MAPRRKHPRNTYRRFDLASISRLEIDDVAQQREGDAPLVVIAGHGGRFLVQAHDGAQMLDEITPFEAYRVSERKVRAAQLSARGVTRVVRSSKVAFPFYFSC